MISRPVTGEFAPYASLYINYVPENSDVLLLLEQNTVKYAEFFLSLTAEEQAYVYEQGKWTLKQILMHIIETERVFIYRAFCFSRNEKTPLPGFDQDVYLNATIVDARSMSSLVDEYRSVRNATLVFFKTLQEPDFLKTGTASNHIVSVRALLYQIIGHEMHHHKVIVEKYCK